MISPLIAQYILDVVWDQIEDADYENQARVIIGGDMVLIDREEFEELRQVITNDRGRKFEDIVTIKEEEQ